MGTDSAFDFGENNVSRKTDDWLMRDIFVGSRQGPVNLPLGGTVSTSRNAPTQSGLTFSGPEGGSFTIPREKVDNNPAMVEFLIKGTPRAQQDQRGSDMQYEHDRMAILDRAVGEMDKRRHRDSIRDVSQGLRESGMGAQQIADAIGWSQGMPLDETDKRISQFSARRGADERRMQGQMTIDDALLLGLESQRYRESRGMPAQDYINKMFNEPRRAEIAQREQQRMAILDASLKNDNLRPTTTIFDADGRVNPMLNFEAKPEPAPKAEVYNPGGGVGLFERTPDGQYRPIKGTSKPPEVVAQAPRVPIQQFGGFYRTWDEQAGAWGSWKQKNAARGNPYMEAIAEDYRQQKGMPPAASGDGIDWSTVPEYGQQPPDFGGWYRNQQAGGNAVVDSYVQRIMGGLPEAKAPFQPAASSAMGQHEQANAAAKAAGKPYYEVGGAKYTVQ